MKPRMRQCHSHMLKSRLIRRSGRRCEGCAYQHRSGHPHQLAGQNGAFELDHKVPLARCGSNKYANLQVLCLPCHDGKTNNGNLTDKEWRRLGRPQDWTRKCAILHGRAKG